MGREREPEPVDRAPRSFGDREVPGAGIDVDIPATRLPIHRDAGWITTFIEAGADPHGARGRNRHGGVGRRDAVAQTAHDADGVLPGSHGAPRAMVFDDVDGHQYGTIVPRG